MSRFLLVVNKILFGRAGKAGKRAEGTRPVLGGLPHYGGTTFGCKLTFINVFKCFRELG